MVSMPHFIKDLRITASWLVDDDADSVITATAFAFLAASLSSTWFTLGDCGQRVASRLFQRYRDLVHDVSDPQA